MEFSGRGSTRSCYLVPAATVSVLVPPASSSLICPLKVWAHRSRARHRSGVSILGHPLQTSFTCISLAKHPVLDLSCLLPDTQGSRTWSWNDNFPVAVAFMCGITRLLADKKITVHPKNRTKIAPFCLLLQGFSSLFHCCSVFLALSPHSITLQFICSLLGAAVLTWLATVRSIFPVMRRNLCRPGPWANTPKKMTVHWLLVLHLLMLKDGGLPAGYSAAHRQSSLFFNSLDMCNILFTGYCYLIP